MNKKERQIRIEETAERLLKTLDPLLPNHTVTMTYEEASIHFRRVRRARDAMRVALDLETRK